MGDDVVRPVSAAFHAAVAGSHAMAVRAVLVDAVPQFGMDPTGVEIPVLGGDVTLSSRADVKSTLSLTVPGQWWSRVAPYGNEIYVARGVRLGNGTIEWCGLGYHRIEQVDQPDAPFGPIQITALDRISQLQQNRLVYPIPVDEGATHRAVFERLVNGGTGGPPIEGTAYAAYSTSPVPIDWPAYNPDTTTIFADQVVADDSYKFLADLAAEQNCVLRFDGGGRLVIASIIVNAAVAVASVHGGAGGTRLKVGRTASRRGVFNIATAYGTDPANATGFVVTFNADSSSPLAWNRTEHPAFGPAPCYVTSPLWQDDAAVEAGSARKLDRYTGLPEPLSISCVPNPAIEGDDVIDVPMAGRHPYRVVVDTHVIPLVADQPAKITTRMLNESEGTIGDLEA